jgi:hypothetical protein
MHVVPRGTLHNPVAYQECWIVLIEPVQTKHTGNAESPLRWCVQRGRLRPSFYG